MGAPARGGSLWRVVDANANRAREGLRVCEDLVRFCLGSEVEFRRVRALRYALSRQLTTLAARSGASPTRGGQLVTARDSERDPGRRSRPAAVRSAEQLLIINLQRTKEAVRALEEASRVVAPRATAGFQDLRFDLYDAERRILLNVAAVRHHRPVRGRRT
jgi:thiamine-phosphate pyrophosphorylase